MTDRDDEMRLVKALAAKLTSSPDFEDFMDQELIEAGRQAIRTRADMLLAVGELVAELHEHRGWSWPELERQIGTSHRNLRRWAKLALNARKKSDTP